MNKKLERKCLRCKWCYKDETDRDGLFRCRRFPPHNYGDLREQITDYPQITARSISCGEWKRKTAAKKKQIVRKINQLKKE